DLHECKHIAQEHADLVRQPGQQLPLMKAVTDALGEGVCVLDRQGRITSWNPAAERLLGWRKDEVLGRSLLALQPRAATERLLRQVSNPTRRPTAPGRGSRAATKPEPSVRHGRGVQAGLGGQ